MRLDLRHADIVSNFLFDPEIVKDMSDDHSEEAMRDVGPFYKINASKTVLGSPMFYFLQPNEHTLFMFTMRTSTVFEVHTLIKPEGRGKEAIVAARDAAKWMFENSTCEKIITYVPTFNKKARVFAKLVGMKDEGICTKSFRRDGKLYDQWVLGLEKEAICQQSQS